MTGFAVVVERDSQFLDLSFALYGVVTSLTFLDRVSFCPDVFTFFIFMVAVLASHIIIFIMGQVREIDRPFAIRFVNRIVNNNILRHGFFFSNRHPPSQHHNETNQNSRRNNPTLLSHRNALLMGDIYITSHPHWQYCGKAMVIMGYIPFLEPFGFNNVSESSVSVKKPD
jgi:hypothetical protein